MASRVPPTVLDWKSKVKEDAGGVDRLTVFAGENVPSGHCKILFFPLQFDERANSVVEKD